MLINLLADEVMSADTTKLWVIAIIAVCMAIVGIMEGLAVIFAINGTARNPEAAPKLRSSMLIGVALIETISIYLLIIAMLLLFVA